MQKLYSILISFNKKQKLCFHTTIHYVMFLINIIVLDYPAKSSESTL